MIMMQQAFNDILLNVTQTNDLISNETSKSSKSFFDSAQIMLSSADTSNSNSTLTSSILKNNFFSNLVANDYLLDNKENYNLNDGASASATTSTSSTSIDKLKSSPLSSGLSSLSSSLTSSSSSSPSSSYMNTSGASSSLSRSSSTCSLLSSTIKQQQQQQQHQSAFNKSLNKSSSSSPGLLNDLFLSSASSLTPPLGSSVSSTNSSTLDNILPFNFCIQQSSSSSSSSTSPTLTKTSNDLNSFSFGKNTNIFKNDPENKKIKTDDFLGLGLEANLNPVVNSSNSNVAPTDVAANKNNSTGTNIDWPLLSSITEQNQRFLLANRDDSQWLTKLNKELCWNINKLTEIVLLNSKLNECINQNNNNNNNNTINSALINNFNMPCNINVNNMNNTNLNSSNYGMNNSNNNNNNNMNNKLARKLVGNTLNTPLASANQQQTSPSNMQPHASVSKFYTMNQSIQQQQQQSMMNFNTNQQKMSLTYQQNYNNQQFNLNSNNSNNNNNNRTFGRIITNNRGYPQRVQC